MLADPVIFVPGITATYLRDEYSLPPEIVWSVTRKNYARVVLHPNNLKFEAREPANVRADQVFEIAYKELIEELREELSPRGSNQIGGVPVYPFGYDWRKSLSETASHLSDFIDEVIERTKLQRSYHEAGYSGRVNLIGHSMGGLVIAGFMSKGQSNADKVNRIATLATPYQGSYESVLKITTGLGVIGTEEPKARERQAARLTPALYHLLPGFENALQAPDGFPNHFFDNRAWQPSVEETLDHFIAENSVHPIEASSLLGNLLKEADIYLGNSVRGLDLGAIGFDQDRWLCVVGVDSKTQVRLSADIQEGHLRYRLSSKDKLNLWNKDDMEPSEWVLTGDGTVPYAGATPPFLDRSKLICITPDDYGTWEVKDRALSATIGGFHGILPNMNMLHRMLATFFRPTPDGSKPVAPTHIWGRPAPDLDNREQQWDPPFQDLRRKRD